MEIIKAIKKSPKLKKIVLKMLMPKGQARPRKWVKWFVNPLFSVRKKGARIQPLTRIDILPFNKFQLGKNSTIEDFCTINNGVGNVIIKDNTRIGLGSVLIGPVEVGSNVRLAQNIVLTAVNHNYEDISVPISQQGVQAKGIIIGDETWIGANSVILPGITIGKHSVIGAGSIVTKSIPSYCVAAGNPCRIIKQYNFKTKKWEKPLFAVQIAS